MLCPHCAKPVHVSHLGVVVCLHCGYIGQVEPVAEKAASRHASSPASFWKQVRTAPFTHYALPGLIILFCIVTSGITLAYKATHTRKPVGTASQAKHTAAKTVSDSKFSTTAPPASTHTNPVTPTPAHTAPTMPAPVPNYVITNDLCSVDATQAPDEFSRSQEMAAVCKTVFPQIEARLTKSSYPALHRIVLDHNKYAAYVAAGVVHVSIDWLHNSPYDPGVIPHELTHVVQNYDGTAPSWLTEGIATYMSYKLKYSIGVAHCNSNENYLSGYGCTGSLLNYIERVYKPSIVKDIHLKLKADAYSDAYFKTETGTALTSLYAECLQAECKGGLTR